MNFERKCTWKQPWFYLFSSKPITQAKFGTGTRKGGNGKMFPTLLNLDGPNDKKRFTYL